MSRFLVARGIFNFIFFCSILFLPFPVSLALLLIGMIYFPHYFEGIIVFLISDLMFGVKEVYFHGEIFISLIVALLLFIIVESFKKKVRGLPEYD
jgi:hypothetical protein